MVQVVTTGSVPPSEFKAVKPYDDVQERIDDAVGNVTESDTIALAAIATAIANLPPEADAIAIAAITAAISTEVTARNTAITTALTNANIIPKTSTAPAIIRGTVDLSTYKTLTPGPLPLQADRIANGIIMREIADYADTNRKYVEAPPLAYWYDRSEVDSDGNKVGFQVGKNVSGWFGNGYDDLGTRFLNGAKDHPGITIGPINDPSTNFKPNLLFGNFASGHCTNQGYAGTRTASCTNGSPVITLPSTTDIEVGMTVHGLTLPAGSTPIPGGATVVSVDSGTQITVSANATATSAVLELWAGWPNAHGIRIGNLCFSKMIGPIRSSPYLSGANYRPAVGIYIGGKSSSGGNFFFSNTLDFMKVDAARDAYFKCVLNTGTGNTWNGSHFGSGELGAAGTIGTLCRMYGNAAAEFNGANQEVGDLGQFNVESASCKQVLFISGVRALRGHLHAEKNQLLGFKPRLMGLNSALVSADRTFIDNEITSATVSAQSVASGNAPGFISLYGKCALRGTWDARFNSLGNGRGALTMAADVMPIDATATTSVVDDAYYLLGAGTLPSFKSVAQTNDAIVRLVNP